MAHGQVSFGEVIKAVGNIKELGDWKADKGLVLSWQEGNRWTGTLDIPVGKPLKFKVGNRSLA